MEIRSERLPTGVTVVSPDGPLDLTVAPTLRDHLHTHISNGSKHIIVDLSSVDLIDSTALGALVAGLKAARKNGGDLRLMGANERVVSLLRLTKLTEVLKLVDITDTSFS